MMTILSPFQFCSRRAFAVFGNKFASMGVGNARNPDISPRSNRLGSQPEAQAAPVQLISDEPRVVMHHFAKILTKHGIRGEDVLSQVSMTLRHKYGHPSPIQVAIDAIKPVLKYQKFKHARQYVPVVLHPKPSTSIAIRWILELASKRIYTGDRPCLERGLIDEIDAIIQGTSSLYAKRMQYHKNPN